MASSAAAPLTPPLRFAAVLVPHRSLSPAGFRLVVGGFAVLSAAIGVAFYLSGAWPVVGFLGLDVLLLWGALKLSYIAARRREELHLTDAALDVRRVDPWGRTQTVRFAPPAWLRVEIDDPPRHESQLRLSSHGQAVTVGSFLLPEERLEVAQALRDALRRLAQPFAMSQRSP